jgi:2-polyprenyl-3-methyl-5-hydroxy-6-metoxy-1,4-benzoquinol methylase
MKYTYRDRMEQLLNFFGTSKRTSSMGTAKPMGAMVQKSAPYFDFDRPEIQELVPIIVLRIFDIGCGAGRLKQALKCRQNAHVTGVEIHSLSELASRSRA